MQRHKKGISQFAFVIEQKNMEYEKRMISLVFIMKVIHVFDEKGTRLCDNVFLFLEIV